MGEFLEHSEGHAEDNKALEKEFNIHFSSLHIIFINYNRLMGCEVTSVYNDEIIGKLGYSQRIVDDLLTRDFRTACLMSQEEINLQGVRNIQGFTQSFATGKLFSTIIGDLESIVYTAGRFVVIEEVKTKKRRFIANKDIITAFTIRDKFCLAGAYGGYLVLWDLEFLEAKLRILLPEGSLNVSTVGLTSKYLFATDNTQPNSLAFCYDIRTAKLKCYAKIPTIEASVRSIAIDDSKYVTAGGDGIWLIDVLKNPEELKVTRGMFVHYPKTSIVCLQKASSYVIGGGVDGYIYAWKIQAMKCTKALKVHDDQITAIGVKDNYVILGCMNGRVKVYTYKITKQEKKNNGAKLQQEEEEGKKAEEDDELITFILVDTYDKEGAIFTIAVSERDPFIYYCQTRQGLFFQKRLPANNQSPSKGALKPFSNEDIFRFNGRSIVNIFGSTIYSLYKMSSKTVFLDIHRIVNDTLSLQEQRIVKLQQECNAQHIAYLINSNEIAYLTKSNKIFTAETFDKIGDALSNANISNFGENSREVFSLQNEKVVSINFVGCSNQSFLMITTNQSVFVFLREGKLMYEERYHQKYEKTVPSSVEVEGRIFIYEQTSFKWRDSEQSWRSLGTIQTNHQQVLHCGKTLSNDTRWRECKATTGQGFTIFYK